jgi:holo-[acyl-carrier protein] synthase
MIIGIGVDLTDHARFEGTLARSGQAFLDRVFTPVEQARCQARRHPHRCFASRFAAKEAVSKALRLGIARMGLLNAEVDNHPDGAPFLRLHGPLATWAAAQPGLRVHLSLSDDPTHSIAMVVVEADKAPPLPPEW